VKNTERAGWVLIGAALGALAHFGLLELLLAAR
jgi:hypothetical protein